MDYKAKKNTQAMEKWGWNSGLGETFRHKNEKLKSELWWTCATCECPQKRSQLKDLSHPVHVNNLPVSTPTDLT